MCRIACYVVVVRFPLKTRMLEAMKAHANLMTAVLSTNQMSQRKRINCLCSSANCSSSYCSPRLGTSVAQRTHRMAETQSAFQATLYLHCCALVVSKCRLVHQGSGNAWATIIEPRLKFGASVARRRLFKEIRQPGALAVYAALRRWTLAASSYVACKTPTGPRIKSGPKLRGSSCLSRANVTANSLTRLRMVKPAAGLGSK